MNDELVKGGQGRTSADMRLSASIVVWCFIILAAALAFFVLTGCQHSIRPLPPMGI